MALSKRRTNKWSKYILDVMIRVYCVYGEYFDTANTRSTRSTNRRNTASTACTRGTWSWNTCEVPWVSTVPNPEIASPVFAILNLEYCEYLHTWYSSTFTRNTVSVVHEVLHLENTVLYLRSTSSRKYWTLLAKCFISKILYSTWLQSSSVYRYWEHLYNYCSIRCKCEQKRRNAHAPRREILIYEYYDNNTGKRNRYWQHKINPNIFFCVLVWYEMVLIAFGILIWYENVTQPFSTFADTRIEQETPTCL